MSEPVAASSDTAAATTARAWLAAMNAHDAAALCALLAEDFAWSDRPASPTNTSAVRLAFGHDRAAAVLAWQDWFAATPDLAFELIRELDCEDWSIQQLRLHGTQHGAPSAIFTPRPRATLAAPRALDLPGCAVLTIRAGHITRLWTYWDETVLRRATTLPHPQADF